MLSTINSLDDILRSLQVFYHCDWLRIQVNTTKRIIYTKYLCVINDVAQDKKN